MHSNAQVVQASSRERGGGVVILSSLGYLVQMWFQLLAPRRVQYTLLIIFGTFRLNLSLLLYRVHEPDGHSLSRQYTPISPLDQKGSFDVMIKVYITWYSVLQDMNC